jgi:hypothetical protein
MLRLSSSALSECRPRSWRRTLLRFRSWVVEVLSQHRRVSKPKYSYFLLYGLIEILLVALTGVFLFLTTIARTSNALLGWNCGYSFFSNVSSSLTDPQFQAGLDFNQIMYGILYAISPEIFPAKDRGTGNALTAAASRVFGLLVRRS